MPRQLRHGLATFGLLCGCVPLTIGSLLQWHTGTAAIEQITTAAEQGLGAATETHLGSLRDIVQRSLATYAGSIADDLALLASMPGMQAALRTLSDAHDAAGAGLGAAELEKLRAELGRYYETGFGRAYREQNHSEGPQAGWLRNLSPSAVALQHQFIFANPHPLGQKHLLDVPAGASGDYGRNHALLQPSLRKLVEHAGYYDIFLVDLDGDVVFSVFKELDFATSLRHGPHRETGLAKAAMQALAARRDAIVATDFARYAPSAEAPAAFAATPLFDGDERVGALVMQLPLDRISTALEVAGLGETGEAYLVGSDHLMRSDARQDLEHRSVVNSFRDPGQGRVDSVGADRALHGETVQVRAANYAGRQVLGAYCPVDFLGRQFALCVEQGEAEALATATAAHAAGKSREAQLLWLSAATWVICSVGVAMAGIWLGRRIGKPIERTAQILAAVAAGNLRQRLETGGEDEIAQMGRSLNAALESVEGLVEATRSGVDDIEHSSQEITSTSHSLANGASRTAASLQQLRAMLQEIADLSDTCSERSGDANMLAKDAQHAVAEGQRHTATMASAMREAKEAAASVAGVLATIDGIAFQTNLLALNAAVEAARAGEAGKGFAVVADEVRNLAGRCAVAARETAQRIQAATERTAAAAEVAELVQASFAAIQTASERGAGLSDEVLTLIQQTVGNLSAANGSAAEIDQHTQQNASAAEQLTATAAIGLEHAQAIVHQLRHFHDGS